MSVIRTNPEGLCALPELVTQVVTVGSGALAYLSGQVAWDWNGELIGRGDHVAQATQIAENLDICLASLGVGREGIVQETIYVVDYQPELARVILAALRAGGQAPPASTLIPVPALAFDGYLVEVTVVIALPG